MSVLCIFIFCFPYLFSLVLFLFSKPKIPKIFLLFLFALFGLMRVVVFILFFISSGSFTFVFLIFELQFKNPKIFSFLFASSLLFFKIENTKNICCSSWFCIVLFQIRQPSVTPPGAWFSFYIIQVMQVKGNNDDIRQLDVVRGWYEPLCFYFCTYTCLYDCTS